MTVPSRLISFPIIDQDALEGSIAAQRADMDKAEIRSRSSALLDDAQHRVLELEDERKTMRKNRLRLKNNIDKLQALYQEMEIAENDVDVELSVQLQTVQLLKAAGVTL